MAFDARIIALRMDYKEENLRAIAKGLNIVLRSNFNIELKRAISFDEYIRNSASRPINRYIRIPAAVYRQITGKDTKEKDEVSIKYGEGVVESRRFANSRHFVLSTSILDNYIIIWFNFHQYLYNDLPGFDTVQNLLARYLSVYGNTQAVYMQTTSKSRSDARFIMYSNGFNRGEETGKDSLTVLKNDYNIDINRCMDNVDNNIAIYYAPYDYANVNKQIYEQTQRFEEFKKKMHHVIIQDKDDGNNMVEKFMDDNTKIMNMLETEKQRVTSAMSAEETGTLFFYELDAIRNPIKPDLISESHFGGKRR